MGDLDLGPCHEGLDLEEFSHVRVLGEAAQR
jgi:hypothetical protein